MKANQSKVIYSIIIIASIILWNVPFGNLILYPFTILGTWFHEMGHGITALLLGGNFHKLHLYPNGSGVAFTSGNFWIGNRFGKAFVAAGGLLGASIVVFLLIAYSKNNQQSKTVLSFFCVALLLSLLIWIRNIWGWIFIGIFSCASLYILFKSNQKIIRITIQIIAIQAMISSFQQMDYLFMNHAYIGGQYLSSDTGQIANQLFLPYWFWGALIASFNIFLIFKSFKKIT